jgi:hypothetical protein
MTGGEGADVFVFLTAAEAGNGPSTRNTIADFEAGVDKLDLSAIAPGQVFVAAFTNVAGQVTYNAGTGLLRGDLDGDGAADYAIQLAGKPALTAGDFLF